MRLTVSLLVVATLCCLTTALFASDWPQFRGPNADGISPETGVNTDWTVRAPAQLWQTELSDNGYAGPAVADGKVFIIDHHGSQDVVRALDLNNGKEIWHFAYDDSSEDNFGFARSTPAISENCVYTLSKLGTVMCLNTKTGEKVWSRNIIKDFAGKLPQWELAMSPLVDGDRVILCPGGENAAVVALNKYSGATLWQGGGSDLPGYATPVAATFDGVRQYVVLTAARLLGIEADNGKVLWSYPWQTGSDVNAATPVIIGNAVFLTSSYHHGCALLEIAGGKPLLRWQNVEMQSQFSTPIYYNGYLYGTTDYPYGHLVCLDSKTGSAMWKWPGFEKGAGIAVSGLLMMGVGDSGEYVLINMTPVGYMELGRFLPLGGRSWTAPVLAERKLLVRNKKVLACLWTFALCHLVSC